MDTNRESTKNHSVPNYANSEFAEQLSERAHHLKDQTVDAYDSSLAMVRKNPISVMFAALGVGLVLGFIFKGR